MSAIKTHILSTTFNRRFRYAPSPPHTQQLTPFRPSASSGTASSICPLRRSLRTYETPDHEAFECENKYSLAKLSRYTHSHLRHNYNGSLPDSMNQPGTPLNSTSSRFYDPRSTHGPRPTHDLRTPVYPLNSTSSGFLR